MKTGRELESSRSSRDEEDRPLDLLVTRRWWNTGARRSPIDARRFYPQGRAREGGGELSLHAREKWRRRQKEKLRRIASDFDRGYIRARFPPFPSWNNLASHIANCWSKVFLLFPIKQG